MQEHLVPRPVDEWGGWQLVAAQAAVAVRLVVAVVWALVLAKVPGCDRKPCGGDCTGVVPEVLAAGLPPVPADLELRLRLVVRTPRERAIHWLVAVLVSVLRAVDYVGTRKSGPWRGGGKTDCVNIE